MRRELPILAALVCVAVALLTGDATLLTALPALVLFGLLGSRRYVGETRLARSRPARSPRRAVRVTRRPAQRAVVGARGGRLVACSMARRGPPVRFSAAL